MVLAFVATLAGCMGGSSQETVPATLDEGTGGIRGLLVSDELFPVVGALVQIPGIATTESDTTGRFSFVGLPEGDVTLNITAPGYEPKDADVRVPSEGFVDLQIAMVGIPGQSPFVTTLLHDGFIACSYSIVYSAGWIFPVCPLGESEDSFTTEVSADWRGGVHEMEWPTADELLFASTLDGPECRASPPPPSKCAALIGGRSPLRILARPEDTEYAAQYAVDSKVTWPVGNYSSTLFSAYSGFFRTEINATFNPICQEINAAAGAPRALGCPFGIGLSTGIRFRYLHTTFYLLLPGDFESFTARPDA